ncbi:hypothetical protein [Streptomyces sp. NBC_01314]|uniref:hypothetical protein n=1 Tax=Streptomyces sp. NBC_01314 TaxID=2903821 RepID=UPI003085AC1D|nr:hypothetical protein OG622_32530 [Streptomyces sp. NBC_01314]
MSGSERGQRAPRRPAHFVFPDQLPGEAEYGTFMNHLTGCADCGYGQVHCETATEMWRTYREAKKAAKKRT